MVLEAAVRDGDVVRAADVNATTFPDAARSYLADGTGLGWCVPERVRESARFVIDAEIVAPVRASLVRRFGVD
ncbi:MAG TPA: hypothetical protein DIU42_07610, partial [Dermacoccus sp.]|nr:hypothetical protein [Dermacoccus sp.]